jgi:DHA1 family bicyclomycin/chloramphenicol resistance-like MFS transporter
VNATFVMRFGMQRLITLTLGIQAIIAVVGLVIAPASLPDPYGFAVFLFWQLCIFFQAGMTLGNLNAIAMEPMGHIAGMAASVIGAVSTVVAAIVVSAIAQVFAPTVSSLLGSVLVMASIGFLIMRYMARVTDRMAPAE